MPDGSAERTRTATKLRVGGFVPFTATDYPNALAAVVFCQGCPWRCAYCHNPHLIPAHGDAASSVDFVRLLDWLATRRGLLDAVVFSGGEPTAQLELADAMAAVRERGFAIGLHTAGAFPRRLEKVLPLVGWIGLDVKAPSSAYADVTGVGGSGDAAFASLELIRAAGVAFEVRTTVHSALTPPDALERLAQELSARGVNRWVLQPFRPNGCADPALVASVPPSGAIDEALVGRLRTRVPDTVVRS